MGNDDNENAIADGYPRKISDDWSGLPSNIDAAVTWPDNGMTYFFKGDEYWKFKNQEGISGYPKKISAGFDGIPNNVDAAFVWGGNGKIYFFKGDDYWKFDPSRKPPVKSVYPRKIGNWDLPPNINAAVQWSNKRTYFFKDDEYYRFNDRRFQIDSGDPPFPRPAGKWWFGCKPKETFALHDDDEGIIKINQDKVISMIFDFVDGDLDLDVIPPDE